MKISEFKDKDSVSFTALVGAVKEGVTNSSAPYLSITLKDNSGSIEGKLWDVKEEQQSFIKVGRFVSVVGNVYLYRNVLQLKVMQIEPVDATTVSVSDYLEYGPIPSDVLRTTINDNIDSIDDFALKAIVSALYLKYDQEIYTSPAAAKNHHEFVGGLATHVVGMLKMANEICKLYPFLNRDLLISGVLLHDIGKIRELGGEAVTEYTLEGKLLGHISISVEMIQETADELELTGESVTLLKHVVLAHHGKREFGSPVLPQLIEAEALHLIDDFDAKMTMINKELDKTAAGEFTSKVYALDNRTFYKPKN